MRSQTRGRLGLWSQEGLTGWTARFHVAQSSGFGQEASVLERPYNMAKWFQMRTKKDASYELVTRHTPPSLIPTVFCALETRH